MPEHVTGPHYSDTGFTYFQCHRPGCAHRDEDCPAYTGWREFQSVAIAEGFCPVHENCRLEPCDPPPDPWPGLQAYGRCPRSGVVHSTGEGQETVYSIGTWVAEDYPDRQNRLTHWPTRH